MNVTILSEVDELDAHREALSREEPLIEGYKAGAQLLAAGLNPYSPGEAGYYDWLKGWRSGTARKLAEILRERAKKLPCNPCTCQGKGLCADVG